MAKIFVSLPIMDKPEMPMIMSLYKAILTSKHKARLHITQNDSLISRVRNTSISAFYDEFPDYDYFVSIDSDLEIKNCYDTDNIFDRLIAHDLDFVGGLYSLKSTKQRRCSSIFMDNNKKVEFGTGLVEMKWLSSGCWCLKRSAVKKMIEAYPELTYDGDDNCAGKKIYGLYIPEIIKLKKEDNPELKRDYFKYASEDWAYCSRWLKIGGKIWADTNIALSHIGKCDYNLFDVDVVKEEIKK